MTTIAYRNGVLASDSRTTIQTDQGGSRFFLCEKLYRKKASFHGKEEEVILGTAGETASSLIFVDWYGSGNPVPEILVLGEADFTVLVLKADGLYEFDKWCRGERVLNDYYAIGSGAKAAMGAMYMGASAKKAIAAACEIDPYSAPPIVTMSLAKPKKPKKPKKPVDPKFKDLIDTTMKAHLPQVVKGITGT